ncbi:DUF2806 domain-containing protein [Nitrosovibrio tenuis]|uniref:Uncharacterized protein n=1 Tax=Nitrosovibrio tenuis TaxID=1233 RepID=A0A1H7HEA1_9PROT|nr:DUF2806 domain-containing protein [Nitrosovibrio tenuis]SEK48591.1 Protein of unknown function [Nitrosovibrio tenuis]
MFLDNKIHACEIGDQNVALFSSICQFIWVQGEPLPLIYDIEHDIYTSHGIDLPALKHLQRIGLISLDAAGYVKKKLGKHTRLFYFGKPTKIQFRQEMNNQLDLGHVLLTEKGKKLSAFCKVASNRNFYEYVIEKWSGQGMITSSILTKCRVEVGHPA